MRALLAVLVVGIVALGAPVEARPAKRGASKRATKSLPVAHKRAHARVTFGRLGVLRPAREIVGRRDEPLTLEEETAKDIAKLLQGPLRNGVTGLYVADARTGTPLFAVNADDPLNPASNVKMISTAAALELLGPDFRYLTRVLGPAPVDGVVRGDVFLLGSYDPTLTSKGLDALATAIAERGVTAIEGDIVVGADPTRDGIFRAVVPIEITAGEPGEAPVATVPVGAEHVVVTVTAKTSKKPQRPRLTYKPEVTRTPEGVPTVTLTIGGTLGKGRSTVYSLWTREHTATAANGLRALLRARGVTVTGGMRVRELGDFIGGAVRAGGLPTELARHESQRLADIVRRVNKRSINWLADRVIMTAAALTHRASPSMRLALDAMYGWLARRAKLGKKDLVIDTGSGLSYRTEISPTELVAIIRSAAGFATDGVDPEVARAWLDSLSIAGTDGTLRHRVKNPGVSARIRGKTGTLSTVIAMSGILDVDPARPLAFALVTNTDSPLSKKRVRRAHDEVMRKLCGYLAQTSAPDLGTVAAPAGADADAETEPDSELETESEAETETDAETDGAATPAAAPAPQAEKTGVVSAVR